jgi:hypothetical protein
MKQLQRDKTDLEDELKVFKGNHALLSQRKEHLESQVSFVSFTVCMLPVLLLSYFVFSPKAGSRGARHVEVANHAHTTRIRRCNN